MKFHLVEYAAFSHSKRWNADYFLSRRLNYRATSGFELLPLRHLAVERREFLQPQDFVDSTFNYVGLENISQSSRLLVDFAPKKGKEIKSRSKIFRSGDVLYGRLRPNLNKCLVVSSVFPEGICSTEIFVLIPDVSIVHPEYLAELLVSREVQNRVQALVAGAALPRVQLPDFLDIPVPIPDIETQQAVVDHLLAARQLVKDYRLTAERLPKAISRAFTKHAFQGHPFELDLRMTRDAEYWKNSLPLPRQRTLSKLEK